MLRFVIGAAVVGFNIYKKLEELNKIDPEKKRRLEEELSCENNEKLIYIVKNKSKESVEWLIAAKILKDRGVIKG